MFHPSVQFVAPFRIYLPDIFFAVNTGSSIINVKAEPMPPVQSVGASQVNGSNFEIIHDIFGFAGRTKFSVVLDYDVDLSDSAWRNKICDQDHAIVDDALWAVNRVLEVYRDRDINRINVRSYHVLQLVRGDLSDVSIVVVDDSLNIVPEFSITWPGFRTMGFGEAVLREDGITSEIETYLKENIEIPIHREFMSSAWNHLWRGQNRLVPVEANTAFESFALSALLQIDPNNALPETSDVYTKLTSLQTVISNLAQQKAKAPIRWFDPSLQGWNGIINPEILLWHKDCYSLRNKVIHRGYSAVQESEAKASIEATTSAMGYIEELIAQIAS